MFQPKHIPRALQWPHQGAKNSTSIRSWPRTLSSKLDRSRSMTSLSARTVCVKAVKVAARAVHKIVFLMINYGKREGGRKKRDRDTQLNCKLIKLLIRLRANHGQTAQHSQQRCLTQRRIPWQNIAPNNAIFRLTRSNDEFLMLESSPRMDGSSCCCYCCCCNKPNDGASTSSCVFLLASSL